MLYNKDNYQSLNIKNKFIFFIFQFPPLFRKENHSNNSFYQSRVSPQHYTSLIITMQQYQISDLPSRYQLAQHIKSSLDEPNLDNVQAKLYAIRQRNYQMARQFFQQKYGSQTAFDQYLQQSNMVDLKPQNSPFEEYEKEFDLKQHLAQKAVQIQQQQMQKITSGLGRRRPQLSSSKKNPWLEAQTKSNRQQQYYSRAQQRPYQINQINNKNFQSIPKSSNYQNYDYIHQDDEHSMDVQVINLKRNQQQEQKGQFLNQFKQYLANKKRGQASLNKQNGQISDGSPQKQFNKSFNNNSVLAQSQNINDSTLRVSKNNSFVKSSSNGFHNNKSCTSSSAPKTLPEQQLVKKIFKSINSKKHRQSQNDSEDYVQKIQLAQYLTENQKILDVLRIGTEQIIQKLQYELQTKDTNKVLFHECLMFVYHLLGKESQQKKLFAKHCFSDIPSGCMLQPQVIKQFEKNFKKLDKTCDLIVKRLQFIEKLALDPMISKIINTPAVFEPKLDKGVSLRRIFQRIEVEALLCAEQDLKAKEYISWAQFIRYFESGHTDRGKYDILRLVESLKNEDKVGFTNIPQTVYEVICAAIQKVDKGEEYLNTHDLIAQILVNKTFQIEKYSFVRGKGNDPRSGNIPMETFEQTLMRIKETAPKFVTMKQFLQYFSVRGRPIEVIEQQIQDKIKQKNQASKITKMEEQIFGHQQNEVDGYDSDPQFYNNSQIADKKEFRRTFVNDKKKSLNDGQNQKGYDFESNDVNLRENIKVTVPKPFKFQQRQKQRLEERSKNRLNRSASAVNNRSMEEFRFKAKEIPDKVKQKGLYQQMIEEDQKKIEDRKKCSMLLTLANEKPFSFYDRKPQRKTKEQRKEFQFKANPIPWFCSVDLLKKKEEEQIYRNQKIARMAQQSLTRAKLPPRMEKDFQQKLARKNIEATKKNERPQSLIKAKEPPNFELLHKQFQSALERKRKQNKTTEIKQFNFTQVKKQKKIPKDFVQNQENFIHPKQNNEQRWRQTLKSSINVFASSTAKFDQQVIKRRKEMEEKKRKDQERERQENERKKVNQQLNKKLQEQIAGKKENVKENELMQQKRKQMKQQEQDFKNRKAEWLANASKQPLLVERPLKRDIKIEKMKRLHQISQNLKKNGIKGRQHDQYFKRDELLLLQDYEFLVQKGQKI